MSLLRRRMMTPPNNFPRRECEVTDADTTLTDSGRRFYKLGNNLAVAAIVKYSTYYGPFLIFFQNAQNDGYKFQMGSEWWTTRGTTKVTYNNTDYYVTSFSNWTTTKPTSTFPYLNDITGVSAYSTPAEAAKDLLDYYYGVI